MTYDTSTVEATITLYLDGLYEGNADKLAAAFHPTADLRSQAGGDLKVLPRDEWLSWVRTRKSGLEQGLAREDFVMTVDRADPSTVFVKLRCQLPPRYFTDYLVLMKLKEGWRIVSKSFRTEVREVG